MAKFDLILTRRTTCKTSKVRVLWHYLGNTTLFIRTSLQVDYFPKHYHVLANTLCVSIWTADIRAQTFIWAFRQALYGGRVSGLLIPFGPWENSTNFRYNRSTPSWIRRFCVMPPRHSFCRTSGLPNIAAQSLRLSFHLKFRRNYCLMRGRGYQTYLYDHLEGLTLQLLRLELEGLKTRCTCLL